MAGAVLQIPKEAPDLLFALAPRAGAGSVFEVWANLGREEWHLPQLARLASRGAA